MHSSRNINPASRRIGWWLLLMAVNLLPAGHPQPQLIPTAPYEDCQTVKKLEYSYYPDSSGYQQSLENITRLDYNRLGRLTDSLLLDSTGRLQTTTNYLYDRRGKLIEIQAYDSSAACYWHELFTTNEQGLVTAVTRLDSLDSLLKKTVYHYDANERLKTIEYHRDGDTTSVINYCDDLGTLVEKRWYDSRHRLMRKAEYNPDGRLRGTMRFFADGRTNWKYIYARQIKRGISETQVLTSNQEERVITIVNDKFDRKITMVMDFGTRGDQPWIELEYDKYGTSSIISEYSAAGQLIYRTETEFDHRGLPLSERYSVFEYDTGQAVEIPYLLYLYEYSDFQLELGYK